MSERIHYRIAAICSMVLGLGILAGIALIYGYIGRHLPAIPSAPVALILMVLTVPATTDSALRGKRWIHYAFTGLGILGYACVIGTIVRYPHGERALLWWVLGFLPLGAYFLSVSVAAFRRGTWPRLLCLSGGSVGILSIVSPLSWFPPNELAYCLFLVALPIFYLLAAAQFFGNPVILTKRFFKRLVMACACFLVLLVPVWFYLDISGMRIFDAELAKLRSSGSMTSINDLLKLTSEAAQDENGKKVVDFVFSLKNDRFVRPMMVGEVAVFGPNLNTNIEQVLGGWSPEMEAAVRDACDKNRELINQAAEISQLPPAKRGTWVNASQAKTLFAFKIPELLAARGLANLLSLHAVLAVKEGRPDEALHDAECILGIANHVGDPSDFLISQMMALALRSIAVNSVQRLAAEAVFSDAALQAFDAAVARTVRPHELARCMEMERLAAIDMCEALKDGRRLDFASNALYRLYGNRLLRFWLNRDAGDVIRIYASLVEAAELSPLELRDKGKELAQEAHWYFPLARMLPNVFRCVTQQHKCDAQLTLTRVALLLMRFKHANGTYPDSLEALEPAFIAAVPNDPFTEKPFDYRRDGEGFLLYSLGEDFTDDGGVVNKDGMSKDIVWRMPH